jgi:hypothetical protein
MALPIIFLIVIPIVLGIAYVHPFDLLEKPPQEEISEEPEVNILYLILTGIWIFFLLRIAIRIKRGTFKVTHRY